MGYRTIFKLEITDDETGEIMSMLMRTNPDACEALEHDYAVKWRGYDGDLEDFSKKFPISVFKLYGEGDDDYDVWIKFYKNGKSYKDRAIITYPPFDKSKLQ